MNSKTKTTTRKAAAKPAKKRGNITQKELTPLLMAARKAYDLQSQYGNIEDGLTFDAWRHQQCMTAVNKPGLTACNHVDFRPLLAHFQTLSGDDGAAFTSLMKTGKPTDHAQPGDTHEARREVAHTIGEILNAHLHLANSSPEQLLAESVEMFATFQPGLPWELSTGPAAYRKMLERKAAIEAKGSGPITVGYVVYLTRQKTRRPDLTLGKDWQAGLAERCTVRQLEQIRATLVNRIAAVEGVGRTQDRNKSQRSQKAKAARDPKDITPRF
jgi:hypothetical protein